MKTSIKKLLLLGICIILALSLLGACTPADEQYDPQPDPDEPHIPMFIIIREEGSGTRAAFEELFANNSFGTHTFYSSLHMQYAVESDFFTIGYISLGFKDDFVKALYIDGVAPTLENVINGSYRFTRPFNLITRQDFSGVAQDFYNFILSLEGQDILEAHGFARVHQGQPFSGTLEPGLVRINGSSSMAAVMEELAFAYMYLNRNSSIEIQATNSAVGLEFAPEDSIYVYQQASPYNLYLHPGAIFDIGMVSREVAINELAANLNSTTIAHDGIAVIVNHANAINGLDSEAVSAIFNGEIDNWLDDVFEQYR